MPFRGALHKPVANPAHGLERKLGIVEFRAQPRHVNIDRARPLFAAAAPHDPQDRFTREHTPRVRDEEFEKADDIALPAKNSDSDKA